MCGRLAGATGRRRALIEFRDQKLENDRLRPPSGVSGLKPEYRASSNSCAQLRRNAGGNEDEERTTRTQCWEVWTGQYSCATAFELNVQVSQPRLKKKFATASFGPGAVANEFSPLLCRVFPSRSGMEGNLLRHFVVHDRITGDAAEEMTVNEYRGRSGDSETVPLHDVFLDGVGFLA